MNVHTSRLYKSRAMVLGLSRGRAAMANGCSIDWGTACQERDFLGGAYGGLEYPGHRRERGVQQ